MLSNTEKYQIHNCVEKRCVRYGKKINQNVNMVFHLVDEIKINYLADYDIL
jgi:hypothetical protein